MSSACAVSPRLCFCCSPLARANPRRPRASKLIVIGVDGMDPVFLERHWASLPNLNRLRQQGDFKRLATTIPPQSPVAWVHVITGMDPGGHGIFDFVHRDPATRMPASSMSEVTEPAHTLTIGPYVIPLSAGGVAQPAYRPRLLADCSPNRACPPASSACPPTSRPPIAKPSHSAGMGTPDLTGTNGTFSFFTDDPAETRQDVPGGKIRRVDVTKGRATLPIEGPPNSLRKDRAATSVDLVVHVDPELPAARFDLAGSGSSSSRRASGASGFGPISNSSRA